MVKKDEQYEAPWDPIWEYVFGEETEPSLSSRAKTRWGRNDSKDEGSLLDYIFPDDEDDEWSRTSSYFQENDKKSGGFWKRRSSPDENGWVLPVSSFEMSFQDDRNETSSTRAGGNIWNRNKGDDGESIMSFLDQPYEIEERVYARQQRKTSWMGGGRKDSQKMKTNSKSKKQNSRRKEQNARRNRGGGSDDESWLSTLSSTFGDEEKQSTQKRRQQQRRRKRRGLFGGWRKTSNSSKKSKSKAKSIPRESWPQLKQRAELEAAKSRGDTEQLGVFSFDSLAHAIEPFVEESSSGESSSEYSDDGDGSSYTSVSWRTEETEAGASIVTEEGDFTVGSYSVGSTSIQKDKGGAGGSMTGSLSRGGGSAALSSNGDNTSTNEVRMKYPSEHATSPLTTIHENESQDPELSAVGEERTWEGDIGDSFDESSRRVPNTLPKSPVSGNVSILSEDNTSRSSYFLPANKIGMVACCRIKNLGEEAEMFGRETGIPMQQLTKEELEVLFPKLRSIPENSSLSRSRSVVIGNSRSFEKDFPAHLQAIVAENGPQSLYEYEYEKGTHKVVVYNQFGPDPRNLLKVMSSNEPPEVVDKIKVTIQVEVRKAEVSFCSAPSYDFEAQSPTSVLSYYTTQASTVSRTDCCIREGRWMGSGYIPLPSSPGVDVVGKVYRINKASEQKYGLSKGDRIMALTKYGGNARYLAIDADQLVRLPESVDPAEAACLAETYLTAFQCLHYGQSQGQRYRKQSLKGKSILILGQMTTTMGSAISQLSTVAAADNVYATAKPKHYQRLTSVGILPLSSDPLQWFERLQGRIDVIISFDEEVTPLIRKLISNNGEILIVTQTGFDPEKERAQFDKKTKLVCTRNDGHDATRVHAYNVHNEWEENLSKCKKDLEHLIELLQAAHVVPHILDRIPLSKVSRAQEIMEVKSVPGFIVCEPWLVSKSRAVLL